MVVCFKNFESLYYILLYEKRMGWTKKGVRTSCKADTSDMLIWRGGPAGIYMIYNKVNKKKYIGKSTNLLERILSYFENSFIVNKSSRIYRALLKFSHAKFSFTIIEFCKIEELSSKEQYYIDKFKPQYNIRKSVCKTPKND
jgi:hypothetical protein